MTPPIRMVSVPPQAHIVWNEDRSEGVIFVDQEPGSTAWPLTAADDAHQASTGRSRRPGIGSALAEAFFEAYEDEEDRPVQTIPLASLTAAPVREEGGAVDRAGLTAELHDYLIAARRKKSLTIPKDLGRRLLAALATREEAPARNPHDPDEPSEAMIEAGLAVDWSNEDERATVVNVWYAMASKRREEAPAEEGEPCEHQPGCDCTVAEEDVARSKPPLRAQPQAREEAQPVDDGATYYGKDCPAGMVQVEFVGCPPSERYSKYGWKPTKTAFIELYVDGLRYRIDAGDIGMNCFDGKPRRGVHINYPMGAELGDRSMNALNLANPGSEPFWKPSSITPPAPEAEKQERVKRLEDALLHIAKTDHHYRTQPKPKPDGGLRGWAGHHAVWALTGQNGSYVNDDEVSEALAALQAEQKGGA